MTLGTVANAICINGGLRKSDIAFLNDLYNNLKEKSLKPIFGFHCWDAHHFPIQMLNKYTAPNIPGVVGNEIFGSFLINYYKISGEKEVKAYIKSLADLMIKKYYAEEGNHRFFKYKITDDLSRFTLNASLKAAVFLIKASEVLQTAEYKTYIFAAFESVINLQKNDGRWNYTFWLKENKEKKQVDFHQGFILDDILLFIKKLWVKEPYLTSYKKGLEFYHKKQFLPNGQGIYRYPRKWPVNIHNQAQGIITFTRAAKAGFGDHYFDFAQTIAEWTIKHMQGPDGHFYYLKYPWFTNKIPYIRWSDAAMAYALAVYLDYAKTR